MAAAVAVAMTANACSKDSKSSTPAQNGYPKTVALEYKLSSTNSTTASLIQYRNETGGTTSINNVALPFTKTFNRTVNKGDDASIAFGMPSQTAAVKVEIRVNGTTVKTQDFQGSSGAVIYQFQ
jgi:hypothetical protein